MLVEISVCWLLNVYYFCDKMFIFHPSFWFTFRLIFRVVEECISVEKHVHWWRKVYIFCSKICLLKKLVPVRKSVCRLAKVNVNWKKSTFSAAKFVSLILYKDFVSLEKSVCWWRKVYKVGKRVCWWRKV